MLIVHFLVFLLVNQIAVKGVLPGVKEAVPLNVQPCVQDVKEVVPLNVQPRVQDVKEAVLLNVQIIVLVIALILALQLLRVLREEVKALVLIQGQDAEVIVQVNVLVNVPQLVRELVLLVVVVVPLVALEYVVVVVLLVVHTTALVLVGDAGEDVGIATNNKKRLLINN